MSKISNEAAKAFVNGYNYRNNNTTVDAQDNDDGHKVTTMRLHGNMIAKRGNGKTLLSHCGWETVTTKSRLNAILSELRLPCIYQKAFVWYWGGGKGIGVPRRVE